MGLNDRFRRRLGVTAALLALALATHTPAAAQCYYDDCDNPLPPDSSTAPATLPAPGSPEHPGTPAPSSSGKTSFWNHNGSVVYLVARGARREFYYQQPRAGMVAEGVTPGTLLFSGVFSAGAYDGTGYLFSRRCPPRSYHVSGTVLQEGSGRVVLTGPASKIDTNCKITSYREDTLVFEYLYSQ